MHFLFVTVLFLKIFVEITDAQLAEDFVCNDGEEFDVCRSPCEQTCDNIRREIQRNCSRPCRPGCVCRRGLVRADDNTCVPPSECIRPICQENEEYSECGSPCESNCTNLRSIFCTKPCYSGCFCKPNFVRDFRGKCIDPRNCRLAGNIQCQANEEYVNCMNFCNTCFISDNCETPYCTPGCDCKPGYFRNSYRQCITAEQCFAEEFALQQQCGLNEVYTSCVNPCNDCHSRGICDEYYNYCTSGCDCKPGFFRNENGICVPGWNCLRRGQFDCDPGEEYFDCIPTCQVTCDTYNNADLTCDTTCNRGCFCKRGLIRRGDGLCVLPSECPASPLRCPSGEIFYQCLPTCRSTCRNLNSSGALCSTDCRQGCFCQSGFVRNDDGVCVPPSECPIVCGPNEEFRTCGSACPVSCENFRERKICPEQTCLRGCFCKPGFVLGPRGNCIRPRNCPVRETIPCCKGFSGRSLGNETNDENSTSIVNNTTTTIPVFTETPSNVSSTTSVAKSTVINEKESDKITTKLEASTTTDRITEIPSTIPIKNKTEPASSQTKSAETPAANGTEQTSTSVTTLTEIKSSTATAAVNLATNVPERQTSTIAVTTSTELKKLSPNTAQNLATNVPKSQTNNIEVTTSTELINSTANADETLFTNVPERQTSSIAVTSSTELKKLSSNTAQNLATNVPKSQTNNIEVTTSTELINST